MPGNLLIQDILMSERGIDDKYRIIHSKTKDHLT